MTLPVKTERYVLKPHQLKLVENVTPSAMETSMTQNVKLQVKHLFKAIAMQLGLPRGVNASNVNQDICGGASRSKDWYALVQLELEPRCYAILRLKR